MKSPYETVSDGRIVDSTVVMAFCNAPTVEPALVLKNVSSGASHASRYATDSTGTMV